MSWGTAHIKYFENEIVRFWIHPGILFINRPGIFIVFPAVKKLYDLQLFFQYAKVFREVCYFSGLVGFNRRAIWHMTFGPFLVPRCCFVGALVRSLCLLAFYLRKFAHIISSGLACYKGRAAGFSQSYTSFHFYNF